MSEVLKGQRDADRFGFGSNWARYLALIDAQRIAAAEQSLRDMLELESLEGLRFLDVGSGSGLFSLAARNLGATVHSFDYDEESVSCAQALREHYWPADRQWAIERGDALDEGYLGQIGTFDVVYSWGGVHHTGDMWRALGNVAPLVDGGGQLFVAIYNDQGRKTSTWKHVKKTYNKLPGRAKWLVLLPAFLRLWGPTTIRDIGKGQPFRSWREKKQDRGMSPWVDVVDWVGGWPFEVARPEEIFLFYKEKVYKEKGLYLENLKTCGGGLGCNESVFRRRRETA
ncbi:class I SAM-dependent methyltransferase [Guyparkeria sp. GHLCS8-2]|uniref:class I SAM-dependent methyltransferase n=1 Tax=Guyparkeria halopsychrophila TaxID=3139421 RepID=UPI0037C64BB5